jgi:membrane protease subunit HflK
MNSPFDPYDRNNHDGGNDPAARVVAFLREHVLKRWPTLVAIAIVITLLTGVYSVGPGEQGVVRTFGRESGKTGPGLHYRLPFAQRADVVNIEQIRRIEVGFRGQERIPTEALMLTGDENIVEAQMIVQYRVAEPTKYLFRLADADKALHATAEVALRSMVGKTTIDDVITTGRAQVELDTKEWLQKLMDSYESGLQITEVQLQVVDAPDEVRDAFHDVVRAREEKEKLINQAKAYEADIIPRARGDRRKIEREAEAYKERRILEAQGDAAKFELQFAEYQKAKEVTRQRIYLETIERIMGKMERTVIVDADVARGTLPILPLGQQPAAPAAGAK